jgi:hypothetical protein
MNIEDFLLGVIAGSIVFIAICFGLACLKLSGVI